MHPMKQSQTFAAAQEPAPPLQPIVSHHLPSQSLSGVGPGASAGAKILHQADFQSQPLYEYMSQQKTGVGGT